MAVKESKPSKYGAKEMQDIKDLGSTAKGVAKTFFFRDSGVGLADTPETQVDYGKGPAPKPQTPKPPADYYKGYGAYAPRYSGTSTRKVSRKRSRKVSSK